METGQSKNRLLLVDGDPKSLRVLDVSLKKAGFDVATATSGREAITLLERSQPDLIISDTDLDEMDGFDLCSQIKARPEWSKIPFLFVSGRKSIEDKIRGLELGVDDYLTKPIYIKEIGIRVRTALQRAERERMESRREGRTRFAGDLSDVGVIDLVQTIELNRKSGIIHIVNRDTRRGSIFFRDGKVIDAEVSRLSGANAMYRLFSWSEGQFAVEFKQIRRHDVIDTPMAPLLMEGMRRLDESAHLLEKLPSPQSVLEVDCRALAEELAELPDEVNSVLRLCDGTRTLQEVVEDSDHPDLEALTFINKLIAGQVIFAREAPDRGGESEPGERLAHWLSEGGAEDGAAAEDTSASSEFAASQLQASEGDVIPSRTPAPRDVSERPSIFEDKNAAEDDEHHETSPPATAEIPRPTLPGFYTPTSEPELKSLEMTQEKVLSEEIPPVPEPVLSAEESLGALLPPTADTSTSGSNEFAPASDTLRGVPIDALFPDQETKPVGPPDVTQPTAIPEIREVQETRNTKPLGLAERLLSEDSAIRASAMHEAIEDEGGKVDGPQATDRNTREYGNPLAEAAAALVQEVVSSSHEIKKETLAPEKPERPTKEVDWGAWPTTGAAATSAKIAEPGANQDQPVKESESAVPADSSEVLAKASVSAEASDPSTAPHLPIGQSEASEFSDSPRSSTPSPPDMALSTHGGPLPAEPPPPPAEEPPQGIKGEPKAEAAVTPEPAPATEVASPANSDPTPNSKSSAKASVSTVQSVSAPARPTPRPKVTVGRSARKTSQARRLWFMASAAFAIGVVGWLVFGKWMTPTGVPQNDAKSVVVETAPAPALEPSRSVEPTKPTTIPPQATPSPTARLPKESPRPGLLLSSSGTTDLRRKCLDVNSDGKGKAKAVSNACKPALEADPKDVEVMVILARAEIDRGRLTEARNLAKKALATDPQRLDAYVFLGTAEQEAGRIEEARTAYKKYLDLAPEGPYARELRAILNNL